MNEIKNKIEIVVVGGGFGGIRAALELVKRHLANVHITLISDKETFEYYPALYRYVTGSSQMEVSIPLSEIFAGRQVEVMHQKVLRLDPSIQDVILENGKYIHYDHLVLAVGSETTYFGIAGLKENSFGIKSAAEALRLKEQITKTLTACKGNSANKADQMRDANFVIIGAGPTGVELAGNLISYAHKVAHEINLDPTLISVSLIEGAPKILPSMPAEFTDPIEQHLRMLGVNLFLNRTIERQEVADVYMKDMQMKTQTLIWTAGARANLLYEASGLPVDKKGKVEVDEYLRSKNDNKVFVIGDGAITKYSGYAQTAFYDGEYVAKVIAATLRGTSIPAYAPEAPINAIPVGEGYAAVYLTWFGMNLRIYGIVGWWLRRIADLRSFMLVLPLPKALLVFLAS